MPTQDKCMKETWNLIKETVANSPLTESEQLNVIDALDEMLGKNLLEYKLPCFQQLLTENEFVVYRDIVGSMNEARTFPWIESEREYRKIVREIFAASGNNPSDEVRHHLLNADLAFEEDNWEDVNRHLGHIV